MVIMTKCNKIKVFVKLIPESKFVSWKAQTLTLKGPGGGTIMPPLNKSNALDLWLGPHLQNLYDYSNWTLWHGLVQSDLSFCTWNFEKLEFKD